MKNKYTPVDCSFVDVIEAAATKHTEGIVEYYKENGAKMLLTGRIDTWVNEGGEEYLIMDHGQKIRLDRIISVFGYPGPAHLL